MKKNIFVACDFSSQDEAVNLIEQIKNHIFGIKVGLQYVTSTGIDGVKALAKFNLPIMYDVKAFDIKNTVKAFAESLKNLGVECIDLLQLHCPPKEVYSKDDTYEMLDTLVNKGKILYYGFSVERIAEAMESIKRPNTKSIQIIFNIFRQKPSENFFQEAAKRNIAIIVRVPLASGMLTGKMNVNSTFAKNDHRTYNINGEAFDIGETFSGVNFTKGLEIVEELKKIIPSNFSLSEFAIKWILMHPEVTVVIPGAKNKKQILENIAPSEKEDIKNLMQKISYIYNEYLKSEIHHRW